MLRNESPCYNCQERKPICHDKCEKYQKFRKEQDRLNKERSKQKIIEYVVDKFNY